MTETAFVTGGSGFIGGTLVRRLRRTTRHGRVGFATDGEPVVFRDFLTRLVATQGVDLTEGRMPAVLAWGAAATMEGVWPGLQLNGAPPLTTLADGLAELAPGVAPREWTT